ncbi:MAG TPA: YdeI/OmpD-associated family protein [Candidatus Nanopelagicales bacterium]
MRFESEVVLNGRTATGIPVPPEVVEALGGGKRIKVVATIGDYSYRNSVVGWGDGFMLSFGAEHRVATGLEPGDGVTIELIRDEAERTVELADDFAAALAANASAKAFFDGLSYSQQRWFSLGVAGAKKPETRTRRIEMYVDMLSKGRAR